jgi:SWI/SNF-related matrix-associated actin-dependent regulator of chromatin subfamily A member 5
VLRFHGPTTERARLKKVAESGELFGSDDHAGEGRGYDVVVTSYEVFDREKSWFRRAFVWRYVVLDEGHKIKNDKTNISVSLQSLAAEYRLILTGTPLQNNLTELWALLHWLYPDVFGENTSKLFSDAFDLTLGKNDLGVMDKARGLLELVMLRRMKESAGVNLDLPKKTEVEMYLPLSPMQRFWYRRLLTRMDKGLLEGLFSQSKDKSTDDVKEESKEAVQGEITKQEDLEDFKGGEWAETRRIVEQVEAESSSSDGKWRKLMNLLMQLRKCCNHPYLLPNAEPEDVDDRISALMLASTKMIFLDKLIEELCIKQGKKVLVFSGFTKMIDVCEDFLHMKGGDGTRFKYGRLDGTTPRARRNLAIRLFNTDPAYKVMMISTRAGGLGINLASASDVVMLDTDWNPQADLQAQARAHRIGQVNPVTIYRLITQGTVEEQMMGRIRKKLYLSAKVTESMRNIHSEIAASGPSGEAEDDLPTLTSGQLMALVRSGSRAIARPEIDPTEMLQWDWETTIQKCRDYQKELENDVKGEEGNAEEEKKWLSEMERVESRVFEGKTHEKNLTSNREIAQEWSREARRVGMERVVMIGGHAVLKETIGNNEVCFMICPSLTTMLIQPIVGSSEDFRRKRSPTSGACQAQAQSHRAPRTLSSLLRRRGASHLYRLSSYLPPGMPPRILCSPTRRQARILLLSSTRVCRM